MYIKFTTTHRASITYDISSNKKLDSMRNNKINIYVSFHDINNIIELLRYTLECSTNVIRPVYNSSH